MIRDRVQQTTTTSGTGTLSLDGPAPSGYLAFASVFTTGAAVYCCVIDGNNWEIFEGVFSTGSPPTVTRVRTLGSSNGGSPVSFTGAAKQIFSDAPAELFGAMAGRLKAATTANVGNAYTLTLPVGGTTIADHEEFSARINATNTGAVTLARNGGAVKNVKKLGNRPLAASDWFAGLLADFRFDATNDCYVWMNAPDQGGINVISATTYTILAEDYGRLLVFTSATGCAVTLPQATGLFAAPFWFEMQNAGAGTITVTPTTSTIDGAANLLALPKTGAEIRSDGANYRARRDAGFMSMPILSKSANYVLAAGDIGYEINFTTASALTLLSAAATGAGNFYCVRNSSPGDVTLTGTVRGITNPLLRPGDWVWIRSDGSALDFIAGRRSFTATNQALALAIGVAHGLGEAPTEIGCMLKCTTANLNYAVGVALDVNTDVLGANITMVIYATATNVVLRLSATASAFYLPDGAAGGTPAYITAASWALVPFAIVRY